MQLVCILFQIFVFSYFKSFILIVFLLILGVGVVLGIKVVIEGGFNVKFIVMGIFVEEGGGGKVQMVSSGCFKDVDFFIMVYFVFFNMVFYVS